MNVLSLFDGMSCGQIALNKAGIKYHNYFACEIDKYAIQVAQENFPNTIQLGDVTKVGTSKSWSQGKEIGVLIAPCRGHHKIDLLMGGSPCQGFSFAGKQLNFDDPRSKLFFEFVRLKDNLQPKYFLLENVKMKKESEDIITKYLGVEPIEINSSLFSAQSRRRLYWTNIPFDKQIQDKGIVLKDILQDLPFSEIPNYLNNTWCGRKRSDMVKSVDDPKASCLTASMWKGQIPTFVKKPIHVGDATNISGYDIIKRVYHEDGKSPTLTTMQGGHREPKVAISCGAIRGRYKIDGVRQDHKMKVSGLTTQQLEIRLDEKTNCLTTVQKDNVVVDNQHWLYRKLTTTECEALQTIPKDYTKYGVFTNDKDYESVLHEHCQRKPISKTQRYKMVGNGWTVAVISHIMKNMEV